MSFALKAQSKHPWKSLIGLFPWFSRLPTCQMQSCLSWFQRIVRCPESWRTTESWSPRLSAQLRGWLSSWETKWWKTLVWAAATSSPENLRVRLSQKGGTTALKISQGPLLHVIRLSIPSFSLYIYTISCPVRAQHAKTNKKISATMICDWFSGVSRIK